MPYINEKRKIELEIFAALASNISCIGDNCDTCGQLNYTLTQICVGYLLNKGERYQNYNDIIGALEGCKMELYRRKVAPYKDLKRKENGDVY